MDEFVAERISRAKDYASQARTAYDAGDKAGAKSKMEEALKQLGIAQHPIADTTSPEHRGFKLWLGPETIIGIIPGLIHHLFENEKQYDGMKNRGVDPVDVVKQRMEDPLYDIIK